MEKVFKALGIIIDTLSNDKGHIMCRKELDVIIQALTELKQIKEANPSEALESLKRIKNIQVCIDYEKDIIKSVNEMLPNSCDKVEQALIKSQEQEKVLKILFEKNVDILELRILIEHHNDKDVLNLYNSERGKELQLTQEDVDLLKRYFK